LIPGPPGLWRLAIQTELSWLIRKVTVCNIKQLNMGNFVLFESHILRHAVIASVLLLVSFLLLNLLVIERHVLQYASNFYIYSANDLCLGTNYYTV
jgi:hypothetical protein